MTTSVFSLFSHSRSCLWSSWRLSRLPPLPSWSSQPRTWLETSSAINRPRKTVTIHLLPPAMFPCLGVGQVIIGAPQSSCQVLLCRQWPCLPQQQPLNFSPVMDKRPHRTLLVQFLKMFLRPDNMKHLLFIYLFCWLNMYFVGVKPSISFTWIFIGCLCDTCNSLMRWTCIFLYGADQFENQVGTCCIVILDASLVNERLGVWKLYFYKMMNYVTVYIHHIFYENVYTICEL